MAGSFDYLMTDTAAPPPSPPATMGNDGSRPEGYNPATGRLQITVRPQQDNAPPPALNPAGGAANGAGAPVDPRARELLIRTVLGEAAGEPDEGQSAVAHVVLNRVASGKWGDSIPRVIAARGQFEPWMTPAGRARMYGYAPTSPEYQRAAAAVDAALAGGVDPTQGATHFYNPTLNARLATKDGRQAVPDWASGEPMATIGGHQFFAPDRALGRPEDGVKRTHPQMLVALDKGEEGQLPAGVMAFAPTGAPAAPAMPAPVRPQAAPLPNAAPPAAPAPQPVAADAGAFSYLTDGEDLPVPPAPPGAIIHEAGGKSRMAGTDLTAQRPANGDPNATAAAMEALRQRATGGDFGVLRHALPAFQGYSMNFGDEAVSVLAGAIAQARGGSFQDAYNVAQEIFKQELERERAENPGLSLAGELTGALANPLGQSAIAGRGANLLQRMWANAKAAGLLGALTGAGSGEGAGNRAMGAGVGGLVGLGVGGVATPAIEGASKAAGVVFAKPIEAARRAWSPENSAYRMAAAEKATAERVDPQGVNRLLDSEITPNGPAAIIDTMGTQGQKLARTVRNLSPEAENELNNLIQPRFEQQAARITNWVRSKFGYPSQKALEDAIDAAQKSTNNVNYKAAYKAGDRPIWSDPSLTGAKKDAANELERLVSSDDVYDAMKAAVKNWRSRAVADGYGGMNPPFRVTPDGRLEQVKGPTGVPVFPNLQFWDYVRRELSDAAKRAARSGSNDEASRIGTQAKAMNKALDILVPEYQAARAGAAGFFHAENALEAGANFFKAKTGEYGLDEARQAIANMNPAERELFRAGYTNAMLDHLKEMGFRQDVVKRLMQSEGAVDRVRLALGSQGARELEAVLRIEGIMQRAMEAVRGNSTTMAQIAGAAAFEGGNPFGSDVGNLSVGAVVGFMLAKGNHALNRRVAEHVAKLLTSRDPETLQRLASMSLRNRRLWNALTDVEKQLTSAVGGRAVAHTPPLAIESMVPARAQDNEPAVERPRAQ